MALLDYSATGEAQELRGNERYLFDVMRVDVDKRRRVSSARRAAAGARWTGTRTDANRCKTMQTDAKPKEERGGPSPRDPPSLPSPAPLTLTPPCSPPTPRRERARGARFTPPGAEEVAAYCRERGNAVDAEAFTAFYESKGWKVGNQPMKDWRAAVRTWERKDRRERASPEKRRSPAGEPRDDRHTNEWLERFEVEL